MARLHKIWNDRSLNIKTKTRIVNTLVFFIILYGAEAWTFSEISKFNKKC